MTKKNKVLKITDLLAQKEAIKKRNDAPKRGTFYVDSLGGSVTIEAPTRDIVNDALEMEDNSDHFIVYQTVIEPNLKDSELQKEFGCVEPTDIVEKLFTIGEISSLAIESMELAGYTDKVTPVDELKN